MDALPGGGHVGKRLSGVVGGESGRIGVWAGLSTDFTGNGTRKGTRGTFRRPSTKKPRQQLLAFPGFASVGLTGFEPATSWSRTNGHLLEKPTNPSDFTTPQAGCTTGCTNSPTPVPDQPPSALVAALLALTAQLSLADRAALARLLLADTPPKGDAG